MSNPQQEIDSSELGARPRRSIFPTAKVTDAFNSSKPALKSHKAAADAQRAVEAQKAVELKARAAAQPPADATADSTEIDASARPLNTPLASLSHTSAEVLPSRNTSPGTRPAASSGDELEESVRLPKGKRKAVGMFTWVYTRNDR